MMQSSRWARQAAATGSEPATSSQAEVAAPSTSTPIAPSEQHDASTGAQANFASGNGTYDDPAIDEFAQTRPPDDLFDDDFVPMDQPVIEHEPEPEPEPKPLPSIPAEPSVRETTQNTRGGRGSRRGGHNHTNPGGPRAGGPPQDRKPATASKPPAAPTEVSNGAAAPSATVSTSASASPAVAAPPPQQAPDAPADAPQGPARMREKAVQGDRTATGGVKKAKLTDAEMAAKLEAMKIKSSQLEAAHARSAADLADYEAREQRAAQRRKEDRQNRQQMMGERERNRLRKLQALGGREWDAEKREEDFAPDSRGARRGAHGGIGGSRFAVEAREAETPEYRDDGGNGAGIGKGGRGRGRGGRGGRGRGGSIAANTRDQPQAPPAASDFPELPSAVKETPGASSPAPVTLDIPFKSAAEKKLGASMIPAEAEHIKSWADQVEDPTSP